MRKNFVITEFNNLEFDWWGDFFEKNKIQYMIMGKEICPKTGKKHIQGYIQFKIKKRLTTIYNLLPKTNIEKAFGTYKDNFNYCSKDGDFMEWGLPIQQGQRTDLYEVYDMIKNGSTLENIMEYDFQLYCRYKNGIEKAIVIHEKKRRKTFRKIECEFISGPTGCGKTKKAMEEAENIYKINGNSLDWFDGYDGEKTLIIDEYNNDVGITKMLNLLDGYELRLPIKGGHTYANWDKIIITSNLKMFELHPQAKTEHKRALFRRLTKLTSMWEKVPRVVICNNDENDYDLDN